MRRDSRAPRRAGPDRQAGTPSSGEAPRSRRGLRTGRGFPAGAGGRRPRRRAGRISRLRGRGRGEGGGANASTRTFAEGRRFFVPTDGDVRRREGEARRARTRGRAGRGWGAPPASAEPGRCIERSGGARRDRECAGKGAGDEASECFRTVAARTRCWADERSGARAAPDDGSTRRARTLSHHHPRYVMRLFFVHPRRSRRLVTRARARRPASPASLAPLPPFRRASRPFARVARASRLRASHARRSRDPETLNRRRRRPPSRISPRCPRLTTAALRRSRRTSPPPASPASPPTSRPPPAPPIASAGSRSRSWARRAGSASP